MPPDFKNQTLTKRDILQIINTGNITGKELTTLLKSYFETNTDTTDNTEENYRLLSKLTNT